MDDGVIVGCECVKEACCLRHEHLPLLPHVLNPSTLNLQQDANDDG